MLARIVEFALRQRLLVSIGMLALIGFGVQAFTQLPIDAFPDVSSTQVKIIMKAPGMTPEEVESRITTPIEIELLGIPHKRIVRSTSKYAIADITVDFDEGTDIYWARQQVTERLNSIARDLPAAADGGLAPITTPLGEMFMFTIDGGDLTLEQRRGLLDWVIRPALRTLPGVADVNSLGGMVRSFEIVPDPIAMNARAITPAMLRDAVQANNRNDGAGRIRDGEETLVVRAEGSVSTLDDLRQIVVTMRDGAPVRIADVASARIGSLTRYGTVTKDGAAEAVEGLVLGLRGANAREVVDGVRRRLAELAPGLPSGVKTTVFYDRGGLVDRAVGTVARALAEACVLVVVLLVLFLGKLRAALVVASVLPLAALATLVLMQQFGLSANLMSLGGLAIAIGMLVDAAVVIVENTATHLSHDAAPETPLTHVVAQSVKEVVTPMVSGIAIIIIVFLPLLTLEGLEGKLFRPVALAIVFALSASLVLSLSAIPVLSSLLLKRGAHRDPWLVRTASAAYEPILRFSLMHPRLIFAGAALALAAAAAAFGMIGKAFMPTMDEGDLIISLEKLPSISLEQSAETDLRIQRAILQAVPEVQGVVARTGADELGLDPMGLNQTDAFLVLKPKEQWRAPDKQALIDALRAVLANFPGVVYNFTQPIEMRVSEMLVGSRGDVAIKIFGTDQPTLNQLAAATAAALKTVPGAEDVFTLKNDGVQYYRVRIDRLAAGRFGLSVDDVQAALRSVLEGQRLGTVLEEGRRTPLLLRGADDIRASALRFAGMNLSLPSGGSVPLARLATLERADGPVKIDHENAQRMALVQTNVRGRDLVGFVNDAKRAVTEHAPLPAGYHAVWGGQFENQQRAAARLQWVVPIALALIFLLLFMTFGSVRQAALVFSNVPFAMIGGVFALWLSGEYLSVPASVGFIALLGVAVLNGVVMVSTFNQLSAQGMPIDQVVRIGARRRLRPVLMTASIAAFGLVPLLFASGPGSEIQRPLAIVVIGGLLSATLLTLVLLPIIYQRFGVRRPTGC